MARNGTRDLVANAPLRLVTVFLSVLLIWGTGLGISIWGMLFIRLNMPQALIGFLFDVLFLSLSALLIFSSATILLSSLFKGSETQFLLSLPARADHVFGFKYQTAVGLSSLAFLWLGSPLVIVYGAVFGAPWYYYFLLPLFLFGFVIIPGSIGALLTVLLVRFLPNQRRTVFIVGLAILIIAAGALLYFLVRGSMMDPSGAPLTQLLGYLGFVRSQFLPNHWITRGMQAACWGEWEEALFYLGLLWSNGLLLYTGTAWVAGRLYRKALDRMATGSDLRRTAARAVVGAIPRLSTGAWLDAALETTLAFVDLQTRVLIVKDFKTFRREPIQWVQVLIFVVLMLLYFSIMRNFYQQDIGSYQIGVSFLNLSVTGLLMCAYTGRFIFPMLSLEGRKFWLLGLLPLKRDQLLWGKFVFSAVGVIIPSLVPIVVSDILLGMSPLGIALHGLTMVVLALGLSGLSVGLGALLPNFRETDPSKIAVGFGGTLNLIFGLILLVLVVGLMIGPYHLYVYNQGEFIHAEPLAEWWFYVSVALGLAVGACAVVMPMRFGADHLNKMEF